MSVQLLCRENIPLPASSIRQARNSFLSPDFLDFRTDRIMRHTISSKRDWLILLGVMLLASFMWQCMPAFFSSLLPRHVPVYGIAQSAHSSTNCWTFGLFPAFFDCGFYPMHLAYKSLCGHMFSFLPE